MKWKRRNRAVQGAFAHAAIAAYAFAQRIWQRIYRLRQKNCLLPRCSEPQMKEWFALIKRVLSRRNYFFLFVASGLLYGVTFSLMTNLIDVRSGLSNMRFDFTLLSGLFFVILSCLGGILVSLQAYALGQKRKQYASATAGVSGVFVSFFATTCPLCKPLLLSLLGLSGSIAILKFGLMLALVSTLLLLGAIFLTLNSMSTGHCCQ